MENHLALSRDLLGGAARRALFHLHLVAADGRRSRIHRARLRREAVRASPRTADEVAAKLAPTARGRGAVHGRRRAAALTRISDAARAAMPATPIADEVAGPRHALFVRHDGAAEGRAVRAARRAHRRRQRACSARRGCCSAWTREHDLSLAGAALSRRAFALLHDACIGSAARSW